MTATELMAAPKGAGVSGDYEMLFGHTSFETAIEIGDYPYGRRVRTEIRYWLEKCLKGAKKGETRFVSCTKNPATGRWNKPHGGVYCDWMWMYVDHRDGHVHAHGLSALDMVKGIARTAALGLWGQIPADERDVLRRCAAVTRTRVPQYHAEWDAVVARVRDAVAAATGDNAGSLYRDAGFDTGAGRVYESDFRLALALVLAEDYGEFTLPDPS